MTGPLVSVLMPAYNHERYVRQAIESVWNQTFQDIELLVIDDGSSDATFAILKGLTSTSAIPMHVDTQENQGVAATLNRLIELAQGEWVSFLASDDFYELNFLERNLSEARRVGRTDIVVHSDAYLVEPSGALSGRINEIAETIPLQGDAFEMAISGCGDVVPSTIFVRLELLRDIGGFDSSMVAEDLDLKLRLARRATFHYIDEPLFYSRHTPGSLGKRPWLWGDSIIRSIEKHEDILGARLPVLLSKSSENISAACFEQGGVRQGLRWAGKAIGHAPGRLAKLKAAARLTARSARGMARSTAIRLAGRERLVRLKRKLQRA
jgi:glycosyltransferase involved in cell wall biosynthesis